MRFSSDQHRRGVLRWNPEDVSIELVEAGRARVIRADGRSSIGRSYAFLDAPLGPDRAVSMRALRLWAAGCPIAWYEILQSNNLITTDLWDFDGTQLRHIHLAHVPDYGVYHRLVVDAGKLEWTEDLVMRNGSDTVRLTSNVYGPWSEGIGLEAGDRADYRVTVDVVEGHMEGKFVEVVALGHDPAGARMRALAVLGYVNLVLGPHVYGPVRIDATIDATRQRRERYVLYASHQLGFGVAVDDFALDSGLSEFKKLSGVGPNKRLTVALERYGQAASASSDELAFAALMSAIDAVASDFYKEREGGSLAKERAKTADAVVRDCNVDNAMKGRIRAMIVSPSLLDKFTFYIREQGLDDALIEEFRTIRGLRNELFHGASASKIHTGMGSAKTILEAIICREMPLDPRMVWRFDRDLNTAGEFELPGFGWAEM